MALAAFPDIRILYLVDGYGLSPWDGDAIVTQMEKNNQRQRRRPGDSVTAITQVIRVRVEDYPTYRTFFDVTLAGGVPRFTMDVWTGAAFQNKVCQFDLKNKPKETPYPPEAIDIAMNLRVFGV